MTFLLKSIAEHIEFNVLLDSDLIIVIKMNLKLY